MNRDSRYANGDPYYLSGDEGRFAIPRSQRPPSSRQPSFAQSCAPRPVRSPFPEMPAYRSNLAHTRKSYLSCEDYDRLESYFLREPEVDFINNTATNGRCWFASVSIPEKVYRLCPPAARDDWKRNVDGDYEHELTEHEIDYILSRIDRFGMPAGSRGVLSGLAAATAEERRMGRAAYDVPSQGATATGRYPGAQDPSSRPGRSTTARAPPVSQMPPTTRQRRHSSAGRTNPGQYGRPSWA